MKPTTSDGNNVCNHKRAMIEMHTGMFVRHEKCNLLIKVVQPMLQAKFSTKAVSGPPLPSGNCEILLQPMDSLSTSANFSASKDLLETYLDILKESRPNFVLEKKPEVINIDDEDDEDSVSVSRDIPIDASESILIVDDSFEETKFDKGLAKSSNVEVIDIDLCEDSQLLQNSLYKDVNEDDEESNESNIGPGSNTSTNDDALQPKTLNTDFSDEITVIDSVVTNDSKFMYLENSGSSKSNKEASRWGVKRKSIGVIEIEDDEIIILDDSFKKPKHDERSSCLRSHQDIGNLTITATKDSRIVLASGSVDLDSSGSENNSSCSSERTDSHFQQTFDSNLALNINHTGSCVPEKTDSHKINVTTENTSVNRAKKPSKFSYKRPAHLISPLTQNVSCSSNASSESSNAMSNIYNPNACNEEKRTGLRPIVIDGNNIGVSHGKGQFSVKGIQICINYFEKRGHRQIKAFIPQYRKRRDVHDILDKMERQGTVVVTPSRRVDGKMVAPYDDRYIVQYAAEVGGVIVTTDNYRDLLEENPNWRQTIQNRLLMFSWVDDLLMFPQDPMGRNGPNLDNFLKFPD